MFEVVVPAGSTAYASGVPLAPAEPPKAVGATSATHLRNRVDLTARVTYEPRSAPGTFSASVSLASPGSLLVPRGRLADGFF
jgi:hypothetical protein